MVSLSLHCPHTISSMLAWGQALPFNPQSVARSRIHTTFGFAFETPQPREGVFSMITLPEFLIVRICSEVKTPTFHQCLFGASTSKPASMCILELTSLTIAHFLFSSTSFATLARFARPATESVAQTFAARLSHRGQKSGHQRTAAYPLRFNLEFAKIITSAGRAPPLAPRVQ